MIIKNVQKSVTGETPVLREEQRIEEQGIRFKVKGSKIKIDVLVKSSQNVMPTKVGIQKYTDWFPASAGTTPGFRIVSGMTTNQN
jgi:hypothetical protein